MEAVKVKWMHPDAMIPQKAGSESAGYDIRCVEAFKISPGETSKIATGLALCIPEGFYGRMAARSSISLRSLVVGAGVIDCTYRGQIMVILHNVGKLDVSIEKGERIAQIVFERYHSPLMMVVDELPPSLRGNSGFGSTGKHEFKYWDHEKFKAKLHEIMDNGKKCTCLTKVQTY